MTTTLKTLSAIALAVAALSTATLATGALAKAPSGQPGARPAPGHPGARPAPAAPIHVSGPIIRKPISFGHPISGLTGFGHRRPFPLSGFHPAPTTPPRVISCHPGTGCTITPVTPPPPRLISCHPGTGCTITPVTPPHFPITFGGNPPVYHGPDHDHGFGHDHWHRNWGYGWRFPIFRTGAYGREDCSYHYRWRTIEVPGVGLERALVKVCEVI